MVVVVERTLECCVRRSKTDQEGKGAVVALHELAGSDMCPVQAFRFYSSLRNLTPGPLLIHEDGSYLSRYQFVQVFRKSLNRIGVDPGAYSSHSFRIGAATEAARWGLGSDLVQKIGRWESNRFRLYICPHLL